MIDVETIIFNQIAGALRSSYDGIWVSGEVTDLPASFPAVTIVEQDNSVVGRMRTTNIENAAALMYEVNVYSNTIGYKKAEAKAIMAAVDAEFARLGFSRTMCNPISNLQDAKIYRMIARYQADVDKDFWVYQAQ